MAKHIVLLRGINIGSRNRIAMPELREALAEAGFDDVQTYVQSGNVVLSSGKSATEVARACKSEISKRFGLDVDVVVRSRAQVAKVVERNPLGKVVTNPKRYQVSFLSAKPSAAVMRKLEEAATEKERVVLVGKEIYAWHPEGVGRSRLWTLLAGRGLGVTATARNWTTVTKLLDLAS